jgi:hypothetical protein
LIGPILFLLLSGCSSGTAGAVLKGINEGMERNYQKNLQEREEKRRDQLVKLQIDRSRREQDSREFQRKLDKQFKEWIESGKNVMTYDSVLLKFGSSESCGQGDIYFACKWLIRRGIFKFEFNLTFNKTTRKMVNGYYYFGE